MQLDLRAKLNCLHSLKLDWRQAVYAGAEQRYGQLGENVKKRIEYEMSIIEEMGLADYFS